MKITKEMDGDKAVVTATLNVGDVLVLVGVFVLVVAAVGFGLIKV